MKLEQLYENFALAQTSRQQAMIASYRLCRAEDMLKTPSYRKKRVSTAKPKQELTEQEKIVMQVLGLKPKDIFALREVTSIDVEEESTDDAAELFKDSTFEEGDE